MLKSESTNIIHPSIHPLFEIECGASLSSLQVAMFLGRRKASGYPLPSTLPKRLVPPAQRAAAAAAAATAAAAADGVTL